MNRKALCAQLGLPETSTDDQITSAIGKAGADVKKKLASAMGLPDAASDSDLYSAAKKIGAQASNLSRILEAAGLGAGTELDETATVALCTKLKGSVATAAPAMQAQIDELQKTVATLTSQLAGGTAQTAVEAAIAAGKLAPAQKDWAVDYCTRDPEGFKKFVGVQPVIVRDGKLLNDAPPGADGMTETESKLCSTLGIKPEDFKATRATLRRETA